LSCFVAGLGFGLVGTPIIIAAQASVPWNERGVVTGGNQFFRAVGSSVGVAVFGALANAVFSVSQTALPNVQSIKTASGVVFWATVLTTLFTAGAAWAMPRHSTPKNQG
ncbi:MAG: MFS transporter, partial [Spirochaetales bacterium]|nr:MFS transporter [Spirochaetales bacterium]